MSDDGEPSGTAGKPMLFTLQRSRLVNVVVVVARYFGGVKLGTGPLARAYAEAVSGAIAQASVMPVVPREELAVHCIYDDVSRIIQLLDEVDASYQPIYGDAVLFEVSVPLSKKDYLLEQLTVRTNARAGFSKIATQGEEINRRRH